RSKHHVGSKDIVFAFPLPEYKQDPHRACDRLQKGFDFLNDLKLCESPTVAFGQRVVVGYRDPVEDRHCSPGWGTHWINVPWCWLTRPETDPIQVEIADQPEFLCSRELVHPFEHLFLKGNPNKRWKEGFCDSLRVFVLEAMGFSLYAQKWEEMIVAVAGKKKDEYHDAAGRILLWCRRHLGPRTGITSTQLSSVIKRLIGLSMVEELDPRHEIQFSYKG
ncbi:MAG TPA: hypothetical protein VF590_07575, partial [Isosphaeraceae bacterium]